MRAVIATGLIIIAGGCNAPRDNPFDPNSPEYLPPEPPEAITDLESDSVSTFGCLMSWTSPVGAYEYRLYYAEEGWDGNNPGIAELYRSEVPGVKPAGMVQRAWIEQNPGRTLSWAMFSVSREGLLSSSSNVIDVTTPIADQKAEITLTAFTNHVSWWGLPDRVTLDVEAVISDPDGVDSVWIEFDGNPLIDLDNSGDRLKWYREIREFDLPGNSIERLIGRILMLYHRDGVGFTTADEEFQVVRVIERIPAILNPAGDTLVAQDPYITLYWEDFAESFEYTYTIEITHMTKTWVPTGVYEDSLISNDLTSYTLSDTLTTAPGRFLWAISVVDRFGNRARSREVSFRIGEDDG